MDVVTAGHVISIPMSEGISAQFSGHGTSSPRLAEPGQYAKSLNVIMPGGRFSSAGETRQRVSPVHRVSPRKRS